ncbi:MAG: metalloenzyme superfamily [Bacteroidota bacterium]|nr:metalloenzyme superfamily [Bacteroidota bacterium]
MQKLISIFFIFLFSYSFSQTKKLLIIGIDGCRADVITKQFAPEMDSIIHLNNTAYSYKMKNERFTMSAANWTSMLTGVHCNKTCARKNNFKHNKIAKYPHFFKYLEQKDSTLQTASFPHWMQINKYIVNGNADYAPYTKEEPSDERVKNKAVEWLQSSNMPDAMFIHFDDVDHNGHAHGFSPKRKEYTDAVSQVDKYVHDIFLKLRERKQKYKEDWLVIISTDHGGRIHHQVGGHAIGIFNKHIRNVFVIMNGDDTKAGEILKPHIVDIACTALKFFDVPVKKEWKLQGKAIGLKK